MIPSEFRTAVTAAKQAIRDRQATEERRQGDLYAKRMQAALREINQPDYPAGMIPWLCDAHPDLYRELTEILPEQIHYLWSQHKPLEEFEQALKRLVETHRLGCALHRSAKGPGRKTLS